MGEPSEAETLRGRDLAIRHADLSVVTEQQYGREGKERTKAKLEVDPGPSHRRRAVRHRKRDVFFVAGRERESADRRNEARGRVKADLGLWQISISDAMQTNMWGGEKISDRLTSSGRVALTLIFPPSTSTSQTLVMLLNFSFLFSSLAAVPRSHCAASASSVTGSRTFLR